MSNPTEVERVDTSAEACAVACMLVSNPNGGLRKDGDGWQKRVNDLIRALQFERDALQVSKAAAEVMLLRRLVRKMGEVLVLVRDRLEDEGDRVYFGSTNHAEVLKDAASDYDSYRWEKGEA